MAASWQATPRRSGKPANPGAKAPGGVCPSRYDLSFLQCLILAPLFLARSYLFQIVIDGYAHLSADFEQGVDVGSDFGSISRKGEDNRFVDRLGQHHEQW
jgi:hypothetical protein